MVTGSILVGHVKVDGAIFPYAPPGIPPGVKWMHVIPRTYSHFDLPNSWIYCFTDTPTGRKARRKWLTLEGLIKGHDAADYMREQVIKFMRTRQYSQTAASIYKRLVAKIKTDTIAFLRTIQQLNIDPWDSNFLEDLFDPANVVLGSLTRCSTAFRYTDSEQQQNLPLSTSDVMHLHDLTFIAKFTNPPYPTPPEPDWDRQISSAQVYSGTLHLFDGQSYGGTHLSLEFGDDANGHPDGRYPDLAEFAFDNCTRSLQQAP